jgi:hypothetical protein
LEKLVGKKFNSLLFSIRMAGLIETLTSLYKQILNKLK